MGYFIDTIGLKLGFLSAPSSGGLATLAHSLTVPGRLAFMRAIMGFSEASAIPAG